MNWKCPRCGGENKDVSGICGDCFAMRPEKVALFTSTEEQQAELFENTKPPSLAQRTFSLNHRIPRSDFFLALCVSITLRFAPVLLTPTPMPSVLLLVICYTLGLFVLLTSAGKRARDMGDNAWWGVFSVFAIFGLVVLLFGRGNKGANKFGPAPYD